MRAADRKQRRRAQYRDVVARCEGGAVKSARKGAVVKPDRPIRSQAKAESPVWFLNCSVQRQALLAFDALREL